MLRSRAVFTLVFTCLIVLACGRSGQASDNSAQGHIPDRTRDLTLSVRNQNFYDATLYAIAPGHYRQRLGFVTGNSEDTFTFRWSAIELRIEIDLLSVGSTVTEPLPVDEGDELELIITPDLHRRIPN